MAKKRTLNEIRQEKNYGYRAPDLNGDHGEEIDYQEWADKANSSEEMKQNRCPLDPVEEAKILIVNKITKHFNDVMFEMVNEEMSKNYLFQSQNYLTEAGYELFEDEYFEFYHIHHGDILYEVMQNITMHHYLMEGLGSGVTNTNTNG